MGDIIVVESEYSDAAYNYSKTANRMHDAVESFRKNVVKMIDSKTIAGKSAQNMRAFMGVMGISLKGTFKEQLSYESKLCTEYVKDIKAADEKMSDNTYAKDTQAISYFDVLEKPYADELLIIDKAAIRGYITNLKNGQIKDIEDYLSRVKRISFDESQGIVKEQNLLIIEKTIASLEALLDIFNAFITCLESFIKSFESMDEFLANKIWARNTITLNTWK